MELEILIAKIYEDNALGIPTLRRRSIMGFTMILLLVYLILFLIDIVAFIYGLKKKKWILFILITVIMVLGIVILGYLWVTSPM